MVWVKGIAAFAALAFAIGGAVAMFQAEWNQASAFLLATLVCDRLAR